MDIKRVYLMVGFEEMSRDHLREKLIDAIMLRLSSWDGPNWQTAVLQDTAWLWEDEEEK